MPKDLQEMRQRVYEANVALPAHGLVKFTWGNVSEVCRELGRIVIKPSGVDYEKLSPENMVVTDLDGNVVKVTSILHLTWPPTSPSTRLGQMSMPLFIPTQRKQLAGRRLVVTFLFTERPMRIISTDRCHAPAR